MFLGGLSREEANKRFWCIDRNGLLVESMGGSLRHAQLAYARPDEEVKDWYRENPSIPNLSLMDGECSLYWSGRRNVLRPCHLV